MSNSRRSSSGIPRDEAGKVEVLPTVYQPSIFDTRADMRIGAAITAANRLLWAGGFQRSIIQAVWVLHCDLRPVLRVGGRSSTIAKIDYCCNLLLRTLGTWAGRNRALSEDVSKVNLDTLSAISQASSEGCNHAIFELKKIMPTLPSIAGCAQNVATISAFQLYYAEEVDFNFMPSASTPEEVRHLVPAERHMRTLLLQLRDGFNEVKATAKVLLDDATSVWQEFGSQAMGPKFAFDLIPINQPAAVSSSPDPESQTEAGTERKRDKAIKKIGAIFKGKGKAKSEEEDSPLQISAPFNPQHVMGLTKPGEHPALDALPPASLDELQARQKEINQQFASSRQDSGAGHHQEQTPSRQRQSEQVAATDFAAAGSRLADAMAGSTLNDDDEDVELDPQRRKSWWRKKALADLEGGL
ncbi:uncharacterized protein J3D65DRAFT_457261 [Phyllosticta citribraziliensis]|uniref:Uncharacterized protein n=1 Tax=Phyllosticta citribraziliensis TaxID=989973 RepID=A0ABR1LF19_9PEZI